MALYSFTHPTGIPLALVGSLGNAVRYGLRYRENIYPERDGVPPAADR